MKLNQSFNCKRFFYSKFSKLTYFDYYKLNKKKWLIFYLTRIINRKNILIQKYDSDKLSNLTLIHFLFIIKILFLALTWSYFLGCVRGYYNNEKQIVLYDLILVD